MAKRPPRAVVIRDLEALVEQGRALAQTRFLKHQDLAEASISRLAWTYEATRLMTYFPKGGVQTFADFNRAGGPPSWNASEPLEAQAAQFTKTLTAQLDCLDKALTQLKANRTRPLKV